MKIRFQTFQGPNHLVPFAAVCAEIDEREHLATEGGGAPADSALEDRRKRLLARMAGEDFAARVPGGLAQCAADLAVQLQASRAQGLPSKVLGERGGRRRILIGFIDPQAATVALRGAVEIVAAIFSGRGDEPAQADRIADRLRRIRSILASLVPSGYTSLAIVRQARQLGIPVQPAVSGSQVWRLGHGARGVHFHGAASERDGFTGTRLAHQKLWANQLVTQLGFPGVEHAVVRSAPAALEAARRIGYPVVVKPVAGSKGEGVCACVEDDAQLESAFAFAAGRSTTGGVLVERRVEGIDHRLGVVGGKLAWAYARHPAAVTGDGESTVEQLLARENARRTQVNATNAEKLYVTLIESDGDVIAALGRQGLSFEARPAAGAVVQLRTVANTSRGGTVSDCIDQVHPDNRAMAESISRGFRLDAVGIDLITPDIGRSWREVPCAVIEVNQTPAMTCEAQAAAVLASHFPDPADARIPALLIIDPPAQYAARVAAAVGAGGLRVGLATEGIASLEGEARCARDATLQQRIGALLADPACEAIVIEAAAPALATTGLPMDRFDLVLLHASVPLQIAGLARAFSARTLYLGGHDALVPEVQAAIGELARAATRRGPTPKR